MQRFLTIMILAFFLAACNTTESSYQGILMVNEEKFILQGYAEENEYTLDGQIGTVSNTVPADQMPRGHLWSNQLKKGTVLYSSKKDASIVLAKQNDGIQVFKKESSD